MEEQLQCIMRGFTQVQQLQIQVASLQTTVQSLQKAFNATILRSETASSSSALPAAAAEPAEEEEPRPLFGCGNSAPRSQQWCRACKDAWMKKQATGKGKDKA